MTTIVIDSTTKQKVNPAALMEYSREIIPMIKQLIYQKELMKEFTENDETVIDYSDAVKQSQEALKKYLATNDDAVTVNNKIKDISNDIKIAIKGAAKVCEYKPDALKAFFVARVREDVDKTVSKGVIFSELEEILK